MAQWITNEALKDALLKFRERGDERWASKSEAVTIDNVTNIVQQVVGDYSSLTPEEIDEIIASL